MSIDYGMGQTNIDHNTGIRYGVIPHHDIGAAWYDDAEADYGAPSCPKCGNPSVAIDADGVPDEYGPEHDEDDNPIESNWEFNGSDHACINCEYTFNSDEAYGDEPNSYYVDQADFKATQSGDDSDIFVILSPYYTRADFCSPCAPGACHLRHPNESGAKAYCFGHDWFEDGVAPYPVYRVSDDSIVLPE